MHKESPFPGMDPYLEGYLWPDVHNRLINEIAKIIGRQIAPKYVARVEIYTVADTEPSAEVGITYPDVAILKQERVEEPAAIYGERKLMISKPDLFLPTNVVVKVPFVNIFDTQKNRLITCIEVLSPVNKRGVGWRTYHEKRKDIHAAGIHLLEIDLLRRGKRHVLNLVKPEPHYLLSLWRADAGKIEVWYNGFQQPLPVLPVPLNSPDSDVPLPLKKALTTIYEDGLYDLSIDYKKTPPPPAFDDKEIQWIKAMIEK